MRAEFSELGHVSSLPGMPRAAAATLVSAWNADLDLASLAASSGRIADLARLDRRVRDCIASPSLASPDLRDAALAAVHLAPAVLGPVTLEVFDVEPIWRVLIERLCKHIPVVWHAPEGVTCDWFPGEVGSAPAPTSPRRTAEICADPRTEVVETLRWTRALISRGVAANCIGIASTATEPYDEHFLVLADGAGIPIHFTHGRPALDTEDGQRCAALADVLLHGISQDRVRRLLSSLRHTTAGRELSPNLLLGIRREAGLPTVSHWSRALEAANENAPVNGPSARVGVAALLEILTLLTKGPEAAEEAGRRLLQGSAAALWTEALWTAPTYALLQTFPTMSVTDERDPSCSISWGPAAHLAGAPRAFVRLLGVNSGQWPRPEAEDSLLPDHILPRRLLRPSSVKDLDRLAWQIIERSVSDEFIISRSRRSATGTALSASVLWPPDSPVRRLGRSRVPEHAFSEFDRLLSRPKEAAADPILASGRLAWINRHRNEVTPHDGRAEPGHILVLDTLAREQSSKSLSLMLRDPLGYIWEYGLGWRSPPAPRSMLTLDSPSFGELVHELLKGAVQELESGYGLSQARPSDIASAVQNAAATALADWPLSRALPPPVLWRHTVAAAARLAEVALVIDEGVSGTTRSWVEVKFGKGVLPPHGLEWTGVLPKLDPSGLMFGGRIDRVDVRADGVARITDYKTGKRPSSRSKPAADHVRELQPVLYGAALRQLLPELSAGCIETSLFGNWQTGALKRAWGGS